MITADFIDFIQRIDNARVELLECTSREEIEKVFSEFEITDYPAKIALLRRCMQIQKTKETPDTDANDKTAYEDHVAIFLRGEWKKDNPAKEPAIPDSGSNLPDADVQKQLPKSKTPFYTEMLCKDLKVSEEECIFFKNFYETNIVSRMRKKYLTQLISVVEDMIEEKQKIKPENRIKSRYRISLESMPQDVMPSRTTFSLCFDNFSFIYYNPNLDSKSIRVSIARQLGYLLQHYGVIHAHNDTENYANLFAFFAINEENSFYTSEHPSNIYSNEMEIINNIKVLSSVYRG